MITPLPSDRFLHGDWSRAQVKLDYHVQVDHHDYSVPYQRATDHVDIRLSASTVEFFHLGKRCASHVRSFEYIQDIDYPPKRELDKAQIRQLATCRWVVEHQKVLITGNRNRQDVSRVRAHPAGMPQGAPCTLSSSGAALLGTRARSRR